MIFWQEYYKGQRSCSATNIKSWCNTMERPWVTIICLSFINISNIFCHKPSLLFHFWLTCYSTKYGYLYMSQDSHCVCCAQLFSHVWLFVTLWTITTRLLCPWDFPGSGVSFPSPGDLPDPVIKPWYPALQAEFLPSEPPGKPCNPGVTRVRHDLVTKPPSPPCRWIV